MIRTTIFPRPSGLVSSAFFAGVAALLTIFMLLLSSCAGVDPTATPGSSTPVPSATSAAAFVVGTLGG